MRSLRTALTLAMAFGAPVAWSADLIEVFDMAYASDPTLQAAEANRYAVAEGTLQARARLLPQINGSYSYSSRDSSGNRAQVDAAAIDSESDIDNTTLRAELTQTIYDHSNYTQLRGARADAARAEAEYDVAFDNLIFRTTEAYLAVLTAQDGLAFAEAEEKAVRRQLDQAEQRFEVGLSAITDVHEARAQADQSRANSILAQNVVEDAFEILFEITGQPVSDLKPLRDELPLDPPEPAIPDEWVGEAMNLNPGLQARQYQLQSAGHSVETARAGHYPTVEAFMSYQDFEDRGNQISAGQLIPGDQQFTDTTIGVRLNVPIFSGGATSSRVRQAVFSREAAADNVEAERRAVTRVTRNAYRAVIAGLSEVQARNQAVISARSALEATEAGFEVGTRTIVDVLISQQVLFQAQREHSRVRHALVLNRLRLNQSTGSIEVADLKKINELLK